MARPIALEIPPRDPRKELIARLESAPSEHAEALLDAYELLQELYDRRVLETVRGALSASDKLTESATRVAESPQSVAALRNLIIIAKTLGSMNPDLVQCIATASIETLGSEQKPVIEPPGLLSLLGQFRRKELRRSIALINRFLETLGTQLKLKGSPGQQE
ncbi:MAG: DUF1641 domain-containing protein [Terracidiphilus sp.]